MGVSIKPAERKRFSIREAIFDEISASISSKVFGPDSKDCKRISS
jgi:hypothetical protein